MWPPLEEKQEARQGDVCRNSRQTLPSFQLASWGTFCLNECRFALLTPPQTPVSRCPWTSLLSPAVTRRKCRAAVSGDASWLGGRQRSSSFLQTSGQRFPNPSAVPCSQQDHLVVSWSSELKTQYTGGKEGKIGCFSLNNCA